MGANAAVHPTDETLYSYALGTLDMAATESVDNHLAACDVCQRRVDAISSDDRLLGRLRDAHGQPGSTGPVVSSLAGMSMLEGGEGQKAPPPADSLPPGLADHPDYDVIRELGHGGMGTVYLAKNRLMGRHEVLKVVSKHMMNRPSALERFLVEIRNAARLQHTNIVTAYSATRIGESIVFAMEYVEGLDLSRLVKAKGPLPVSNACNYVHQVALALQHACELGMVHRDIKPGNLMLAKQGNRGVIKVLDFGLAKVKSEGAEDGGLTHDGQMLGTPDYVAPEQIRDARTADIRADIYSLGCTLYCLLTGSPPFHADNLYEMLQAHHSMDAMPLNLKRPEVPVELAALVAMMMAKEPERRFQTPKDVARALLPFFKKGMVRIPSAAGPTAEMSEPGRADVARGPTRTPAAPAQPTKASMTPHAAPPTKPLPATPHAGPARNELPKFKESEPLARPEQTVTTPARPARWLWSLAAVGLLLLGIAVGGAAIVAFKKPNGANEVVNSPVHMAAVTQPVVTGNSSERLDARKLEKKIVPESAPSPTLGAGDNEDGSDDAVEDPTSAFAAEPAMATAEPPAAATVIALPVVADKATRRAEFQPLFNGKNLDGWKQNPEQRGNWHVVNHVLVGGPGLAPSHLYTQRDDFKDFHLRVEARFNKGGSSGVFFRCPFGPRLPEDNPKWPDGYEATINNSRVVRNNTGGISPGVGSDVFTTQIRKVPFGEWFTLDVIVDGNAIAVLVNGKSSGYHVDKKQLFSSGHIALQQYSPTTIVEFRKIDIRELSPTTSNDLKEIRRIQMGRVTRVAFSPNGLGFLSGASPNEHWVHKGGQHWFSGGAGTLRLFESATGQTRATMVGVGSPVMAMAVSSDGRFAASCPGVVSRSPILSWDLATGKQVHKLVEKDAISKLVCTALAFSPDGTRIMAASTDGALLTWDLATEQQRSPMTLKAGPIKRHEFPVAAFGSNARHLITGRIGGPIEMWDPESGRKLQMFVGHVGEVSSVASSADGRFVLSGGSDKTVRLWDVASGKGLKQFTSGDGPVRCVAFSHDSRRALSADVYGLIHLWDLASGKELCSLEGHTMAVNSVAFSPDGRRAVSGSDDRTVRLWQLPE